MDFEGLEANYIAGTPFVGASVKYYAGPGRHRGEVSAWDPVARRKAWSIKESFPVWSGTVVTAGDVVFYGTMEGWFKAVHARTGELLWQFKTGSGIIGQPITYRAPDGRQYVAVLSGIGGWPGALVVNDLATRRPTRLRRRSRSASGRGAWRSPTQATWRSRRTARRTTSPSWISGPAR